MEVLRLFEFVDKLQNEANEFKRLSKQADSKERAIVFKTKANDYKTIAADLDRLLRHHNS